VGFFCPVVNEPTMRAGLRLPVMERFSTVQGEGAFSGQAAYFIRLSGCNVGCTWCDVKESWEAGRHPLMAIDELVTEASGHHTRIAVITGGEPLMHDLEPLTEGLRKAGFRTHLETSGAHPLSGTWHHICLSPKKFKPALSEVFAAADELKVIVFNPHDLTWCDEQAARVGPACTLFLQPEWDQREKMMPLIVEKVKADPRWRISLQIHKYLQIP
jgi:organic radical activating enzyme